MIKVGMTLSTDVVKICGMSVKIRGKIPTTF